MKKIAVFSFLLISVNFIMTCQQKLFEDIIVMENISLDTLIDDQWLIIRQT